MNKSLIIIRRTLITWIFILLSGIPINGFSQPNIDAAINNLKKIYAENVKGMAQKRIFFNKSEGLIDVGLEGYQIPITAHIIYKMNASYHPPENTLIFRWPSKISEQLRKVFPDSETGITIIFKSKDACYEIIDAIEQIRELMKAN